MSGISLWTFRSLPTPTSLAFVGDGDETVLRIHVHELHGVEPWRGLSPASRPPHVPETSRTTSVMSGMSNPLPLSGSRRRLAYLTLPVVRGAAPSASVLCCPVVRAAERRGLWPIRRAGSASSSFERTRSSLKPTMTSPGLTSARSAGLFEATFLTPAPPSNAP